MDVRGFDRERAAEVAGDAGARLRNAPGVLAIATAAIAPFGASAMTDITVVGSPFVPASDADLPNVTAVSDNYFHVTGTRILRGRSFGAGDATGADPVAIVNHSMARRYSGDASPFSSCIQPASGPCTRVVGIVEDVTDAPSTFEAPMRFYLLLSQTMEPAPELIVRSAQGRARQLAAFARSLAPEERRVAVEVTADRIRRGLRPWRTATTLFLLVGGIALVLSCLDIYSVTSCLVTERMPPFGVRVAFGASPGGLMRLVLGDGLRLVLAGSAICMLAALAGGRLLGSLLYDVSLFEPRVYIAGLACLTAASILAMVPPVVRAIRIDPLVALREP